LTAADTESHQPAQRSFAALRDPGFRPYFLYSALAMMADSVEHVISYWVVFQKFQSPALGGYAVLSHWLPMLFFGVFMGALADRYDSRRLIQIGMLLFMACSLAWGILFFTDTLEAWHSAVILTVHGIASVFWGPPGQVLLHDIVGPQQLPSAIRLNATSRYLGLVAGPAVGAAFLLALGPTYGILLNAVVYLPLILFLWKAPYGPRFQKVRAPARPVRGFSDIATTIASIRGSRIIVSMILLSGCASLIISNAYQAQMPGYAQDLGHGDAGLLYGLLLAADAAGALAATAAADGVPAGDDLVLRSCRLCHDHDLSAGARAAVCRRVRRAVLQFDDPGAGAAQRARRDPRAGAGALQHGGPGLARLQRHHGRTRRQPDRHPLVARAERHAAARDNAAAAAVDAVGGL
jgi:MFS family permease